MFMLISEKQKEKLFEFLPNQAETLIRNGDLDSIVTELMFLTMEVFDNDEPTEKSREIERLMDDLLWQNNHPNDFQT